MTKHKAAETAVAVSFARTLTFKRWMLAGVLLVAAASCVVVPITEYSFDIWVASSQIAGNQATLPIDPLDDPPLPIVAPAGKHHKALTMVMDFAGVTEPIFHTVDEAVIDQFAPIVGVMVDGNAYAFPTYMLSDPTNHVVNLVLNDKPITVTYCNMADCARVLTQDESLGVIGLRNGGLDLDDQMVVKLGDDRFGQESAALPLLDYEFESLIYRDWRNRHPNTLVYDGAKPGTISKPWAALVKEESANAEDR